MTDLAHAIWAGATASVAFAGHRVAIRWLTQREARDEREKGMQAEVDALREQVKGLESQWKTFQANHRAGAR